MYGGYLYSIPGYSAFQPLSYPSVSLMGQTNLQNVPMSNIPPEIPQSTDYIQLTGSVKQSTDTESKNLEEKPTKMEVDHEITERTGIGTMDRSKSGDIEDQFGTEIVPAKQEHKPYEVSTNILPLKQIPAPNIIANKMNEQMSSEIATNLVVPKETRHPFPKNGEAICSTAITKTVDTTVNAQRTKLKPSERFSLKTSIPISKLDMKCVNASNEEKFQMRNDLIFNTSKNESQAKVSVQGNILVNNSTVTTQAHNYPIDASNTTSKNVATLLNAAETLNQVENIQKGQDCGKSDKKSNNFHQVNVNQTVQNALTKQSFDSTKNQSELDQKNNFLFVQNKIHTPQLLVALPQTNAQQNQMLVKKNFSSEPKNPIAPSRQLSLSKNKKDLTPKVESVHTVNKVVALKRTHQDNGDENDFENLITENQIYGSKIVVKEKGLTKEAKSKLQNDKSNQNLVKTHEGDVKNVVIQPNFLYLSNVHIQSNPTTLTNVMMYKSSHNDINETSTDINDNSNINIINNFNFNGDTIQLQNIHREMKSNILQPISNNQNLMWQHGKQKVIISPQIIYEVPMILDSETKVKNGLNFNNFAGDAKKSIGTDPLDSQHSIVRERNVVSHLDLVERRKRLKRMKLNNREGCNKVEKKIIESCKILTSGDILKELEKEFLYSKGFYDESSESDSEYEDGKLKQCKEILREFGSKKIESKFPKKEQISFLDQFGLASKDAFKDRLLNKLERSMKVDSFAKACIAADRLDYMTKSVAQNNRVEITTKSFSLETFHMEKLPDDSDLEAKRKFFACLELRITNNKEKTAYEKTWLSIIKDRKKRNGETPFTKYCEEIYEKLRHTFDNDSLDTKGQLKIMTEIKESVYENNNLIKLSIDSERKDNIHILAEKNITQLTRLTKMLDSSMKMLRNKNKRNGYFVEDSSKMCKHGVSNIVALKSVQEQKISFTAPAISMDEPVSSACGAEPISLNPQESRITQETRNEQFTMNEPSDSEVPCGWSEWPGVKAVVDSYRKYYQDMRQEHQDLQEKTEMAKVNGANLKKQIEELKFSFKLLALGRQASQTRETELKRSVDLIMKCVNSIKKNKSHTET